MIKEIIFGEEGRNRVKSGIDRAAKAVSVTLGAVGMSALIDWEGLDPINSDDGKTILLNLDFKDKYENMGLKMLRKAALRTSSEGGDGTATTTILTQAIVQEAMKAVGSDSSKVGEVKERLEKGLVEVLAELSKIKRDVKEEDIERIAMISSLDAEVAKIISDIIKEVGVNGIVTVEKANAIGYTKEVVKGARFDKGLISPYFITDFEHEQTVLENPYIFLIDRKLSSNEQISAIMKSVEATNHKQVLFIADDTDSIALATLIQNSQSVNYIDKNGAAKQGTYKLACVKNPYSGQRSKDFLHDIAVLTGATVISEEAGMKLQEATVALGGRAEKVIVTKDNCTIIGGKSSEALNDRIKTIQDKIGSTTSEYERNMLEERLASLTGGIGVIRVGTYTDTDFNAKKLKFDNAINATQAALQEGVLPGGGLALAKIETRDIIFENALIAPLRQQVANAGMEWYKVLAMIQEANKPLNSLNYGINFKTKELVDMFDAGIIDPFKVTRLALESAVSIATTLITNETFIVNSPEENEKK